jgi:hypothetical protein
MVLTGTGICFLSMGVLVPATAVLLFVPSRRVVPPPTVQADPPVRSD